MIDKMLIVGNQNCIRCENHATFELRYQWNEVLKKTQAVPTYVICLNNDSGGDTFSQAYGAN